MYHIKSKQWWQCAGTRAIRTAAQAAVAVIGTSAVLSEVDWRLVGSATVVAAVMSLLMSLKGLPEEKE